MDATNIDETFKNSSESCKKFGLELKTTAKTYDEAAAQSQKFIQTQHDSMLTMNTFGKVVKGAGAAVKTLAVSMLNMIAITAIIALIGQAVKYLDSLHLSAAEAAEAVEKAVSTFETQRAAINDNIESVESLKDRYDELSRGVSEAGDNVSLSAEEYAEYKDIVQQIVDLTPSVIQGYNDEGEAILNRNGLIEQSIELMKQQRIEQARQAAYSTAGNDGQKSNLDAAVIDFKSSYQKQSEDAAKIAKSFSDQFGKALKELPEGKTTSGFQEIIEKYAGAKLSDIKAT